jgi:hypothetical protein
MGILDPPALALYASWKSVPIFVPAAGLQIATGTPSLLVASSGSIFIPGWSMSGNTSGQSLATMVTGLPPQCSGVKVELLTTNSGTTAGLTHVWQLYASQPNEGDSISLNQILDDPRIKPSPSATTTYQTILLEEYLPVNPSRELFLRIARQPADTADTWTGSVVVAGLRVTPVAAPPAAVQVQSGNAYNSWPMIVAVGSNLVCAYSRGAQHGQPDTTRAIYSSTSTDGGATWSASTLKIDNAGLDDSTVGIGLDSSNNILLWTRQDTSGNVETQSLYKSTDGGSTFTLFSSPTFAVPPIQITNIFAVPTVGLMALWHGASDGSSVAWGTVKSTDNGATWTQAVVQTSLTTDTWPVEITAQYIGSGQIIAIGRTNSSNATTIKSQFQLTSTDYGVTWTKAATNVTDVTTSTPSLIYDSGTGLLSLYYYRRGLLASLRRRDVLASTIFSAPMSWPDPVVIAVGTTSLTEAGNVDATALNGKHIAAFYSGPDGGNPAIYVTSIAAPTS